MIIYPWNFVYSITAKINWDSVWKKDIQSRSKTWLSVNTPGYRSFPNTKQLADKRMASVARSCRVCVYIYMNECVFLMCVSERESNACLETIFERTKIPASDHRRGGQESAKTSLAIPNGCSEVATRLRLFLVSLGLKAFHISKELLFCPD